MPFYWSDKEVKTMLATKTDSEKVALEQALRRVESEVDPVLKTLWERVRRQGPRREPASTAAASEEKTRFRRD
jgi:CHAT domain-containing protein